MTVPISDKSVLPSQVVPLSRSFRHRTLVACSNCRHRKAKCDGKRPVCGACADRYHDKPCLYVKPKDLKAKTQHRYKKKQNFLKKRKRTTETKSLELATQDIPVPSSTDPGSDEMVLHQLRQLRLAAQDFLDRHKNMDNASLPSLEDWTSITNDHTPTPSGHTTEDVNSQGKLQLLASSWTQLCEQGKALIYDPDCALLSSEWNPTFCDRTLPHQHSESSIIVSNVPTPLPEIEVYPASSYDTGNHRGSQYARSAFHPQQASHAARNTLSSLTDGILYNQNSASASNLLEHLFSSPLPKAFPLSQFSADFMEDLGGMYGMHKHTSCTKANFPCIGTSNIYSDSHGGCANQAFPTT